MTQEYFFDRHRPSFDAILYYFQSGGRIKRPEAVPVDIFIKELKFFQMGDDAMEKFWESEGYRKPTEQILPKNQLQRRVWLLMEHPDSSFFARVVAFISVFVIILSIAAFCLETIPEFQDRYRPFNDTLQAISPGETRAEWGNPFFIVEVACIL
jgi:hypothetical protein